MSSYIHAIDVDIARLRAVAAQVEAAGGELRRLRAPAAGDLDSGEAWTGHLTALGDELVAIGAALAAVAQTYAGADEDAARPFGAVSRWLR